MLMTKKELAVVCGGLLMAGVAFAATDAVKESFESYGLGAAVSTLGAVWSGSGSVAELETAYAQPAGFVIPDAEHAKILSIDDSVLCTPAALTAGEPALVDMMVQAMVPEEALAAPTDDEVQIAVGVDRGDVENKGVLKVWCTPRGQTTPAWCELRAVDGGTWHRVTFVFDYASGYAQVRIDGEPVMTAAGSLTVSINDQAGAWYKLAVAKTKLTSVEVVGTTGLDDLRIVAGADAMAAANVEGAVNGVEYAWFDKNGLAWNTDLDQPAFDASGLTLKAKYETGLSPFDGEKFVLKAMAMSGDKTTFTIPAMTPPSGYTVRLVYASDPGFTTDVGYVPVEAGKTTVEVSGLEGSLYYYRLEAVK